MWSLWCMWCAEGRLGHAQAGVLCNDSVRRELVPVWDRSAGGSDPHQEGWAVKKKSSFDETLSSRFWCLLWLSHLSATETTERKMCLWKDPAHQRDAVTWVIDYLKRTFWKHFYNSLKQGGEWAPTGLVSGYVTLVAHPAPSSENTPHFTATLHTLTPTPLAGL